MTRNDPGATSPAKISARARAAEAVRLRAEGRTYAQVAETAGYPSADAARKAVRRTLDRTEAANVGELRAVETEHLLSLRVATVDELERARAAAEPLSPAVVNAAVKVSDRLCRLNGLDAPQRVEVSEPVDIDEAVALLLQIAETGGDPLATLDAAAAEVLAEGDGE